MRRRGAAALLLFLLAPLPPAMPAAELPRREEIPRIGFVSPTSPGPRNVAFLRGLEDLGYVEGRNISVVMRFAAGRPEQLPGLIDELIQRKVDVLVVGATIGAKAAKRATTTIPIVFAGSSDPVAGEIVTNLARPGGNITGFSLAYGGGFAGKWLELLQQVNPNVSHFAVLWSSSNVAARQFVAEIEAAARILRVRVDAHHAANLSELDAALVTIGNSGAKGLIVTPSPFAATNQARLLKFAESRKLPAIYFVEDFVEAGGLMSYGPSITDTYRRAASYVDKILEGAKAGDLPVEQPTKFGLAINLNTARALGLDIPPSILHRADRVIE